MHQRQHRHPAPAGTQHPHRQVPNSHRHPTPAPADTQHPPRHPPPGGFQHPPGHPTPEHRHPPCADPSIRGTKHGSAAQRRQHPRQHCRGTRHSQGHPKHDSRQHPRPAVPRVPHSRSSHCQCRCPTPAMTPLSPLQVPASPNALSTMPGTDHRRGTGTAGCRDARPPWQCARQALRRWGHPDTQLSPPRRRWWQWPVLTALSCGSGAAPSAPPDMDGGDRRPPQAERRCRHPAADSAAAAPTPRGAGGRVG